MLSDHKGKEILRYERNYTVFDLETTGLDTEQDHIVEIGAVKVRNGQIIATFDTLVNPKWPIPQEVINLHGITDEMVKDAPDIATALGMFNCFIERDVLVGQNIGRFDLPFIWRDSLNLFSFYIGNEYIDNLTTARKAHPELEHHHLRDLCKMYGIPRDGAHRALNDCRMTMTAYEILSRKAYGDEK